MGFKADTATHKWQWNLLEALGLAKNYQLISCSWGLESWSSSCAQAAKLCTVWEHCLSHFSHHKSIIRDGRDWVSHMDRSVCPGLWSLVLKTLEPIAPCVNELTLVCTMFLFKLGTGDQAQKSHNLSQMHVKTPGIKEEASLLSGFSFFVFLLSIFA